MSKPYNNPSFPASLEAVLNDLPTDAAAAVKSEIEAMTAVQAEMSAVEALAWFLPAVHRELTVTPVICPGIFDVVIDKTFQEAVEDYLDLMPSHQRCTHVLVAGHHSDPGNDELLAQPRLQSILDGWMSDVKLISQVQAANAPAQAAWIADQIKELGLTAVALRTHSSHISRAYLTLLKELEKRGLDRQVVLLPWWRPCHAYEAFPLTEPWEDQCYSNATLRRGEVARNCDYVAKGNVASPATAEAYMNWLRTESPVAEVLKRANRL